MEFWCGGMGRSQLSIVQIPIRKLQGTRKRPLHEANEKISFGLKSRPELAYSSEARNAAFPFWVVSFIIYTPQIQPQNNKRSVRLYTFMHKCWHSSTIRVQTIPILLLEKFAGSTFLAPRRVKLRVPIWYSFIIKIIVWGCSG